MTDRAKVTSFILGMTVALAMVDPTKAQSVDEALTWDQTLGLCASCHGVDGKGIRDLQAPRLAGQGKRYLAEQLAHFARGRRGTHEDDMSGQSMAASATMLDEALITRLADYYASLETETQADLASDQTDRLEGPGGALYAAYCAACHGPSAEGSDVLYVPNLVLLDAAYLRGQIKAYQNGWRGGENASTRAKAMRQMSFQFKSDNEIDDVIRYLTGAEEAAATGETGL